MPEFIEEVIWLPLNEALSQINLPHIAWLTKQTELYPDTIWAATIDRYTEDGLHKMKVVKDFYVNPVK